MTDKQPEALRLAEMFDCFERSSHRTKGGQPLHIAAALELRRLHSSERNGWQCAVDLAQKCKRLEQTVDLLLPTLIQARELMANGDDEAAFAVMDEAIAKAAGEQP